MLMKPGALNLAELIADSTRISELKTPDQDSHPGGKAVHPTERHKVRILLSNLFWAHSDLS